MTVHLLCAIQIKSRILVLMIAVLDVDKFRLKLLSACLLRIGVFAASVLLVAELCAWCGGAA